MTLQTRHFVFAVLLHGILLAFLLLSVECSSPIEQPEVIQGTMVKPSDIPKPSVPAQPAPTPPKPDALPDQGPQQKVPSEIQADEARIQREKQEAADRQAEEQKKQQEAQKAAEAEKQRQEAAKQEELRQQQLALDKQKAEEQAKAEAKKKQEDEAKRKQEEAKKQQEAAAAELRKQLDQEAQQQQSAMHEREKAEQAKRDALERRKLQQQIAEQAGQEYGKVAQATWIDQLGAAIHPHFHIPPGTDPSLKCKVRLQIGPTGQVMTANVVTSSGNQLFDNSVLSAVYGSQPLPLPDDPSLLNQAIILTFTPQS
jgi:colicin import membrane protein